MKHHVVIGLNPGPYTGEGTNTYVLPGAVPTLIDAAVASTDYIDQLQAALLPGESPSGALSQVLVTHNHPDHIDGVGAVLARFATAVPAKFPWPETDPSLERAWRPLADDAVVPAGDGHLWVLHTPGHAPDHVCFYDPRSAVVFAGDLVRNGGTIVIPATKGGHLASYLRSLNRILELKPRRLLPGHGEAVENPSALIRRYLEHRRQREQQIVDVLKRGPSTAADIMAAIYEGLDETRRRAARESVLAHLVRLAELGHARQDEELWTLV